MWTIRGIQWQNSRWNHPHPDSPEGRQALDNLRTRIPDCNYLGLMTRIRVADGSNTATPEPETTLQELEYMVDAAHARGLKVILRIHRRGGVWSFVPPDMNEWFPNYSNAVNYWADFCQAKGVEVLQIGNELEPLILEQQNDLWEQVIASARTHYSGIISYNSNWPFDRQTVNAKLSATWFSSLDIIGFSNYPSLFGEAQYIVDYPYPATAPVEDLRYKFRHKWEPAGEFNMPEVFRQISLQHGKPILFAIGLGSFYTAVCEPWTMVKSGDLIDLQGQANWFEALFQEFGNTPEFIGCYVDGGWWTIPEPSPQNRDFTIQNKPAEAVVKENFQRLAPTAKNVLGKILPIALVGGIVYLSRK